METAILYVALFFGFSIIGYYFETIMKKVSKKPNNTIISGPYHPFYGLGAMFMFFICGLGFSPWLQLLAIIPTLILGEYLGGLLFNKVLKLQLWDYSSKKFNLQGQICLSVSIGWAVVVALFVFLMYGLLSSWLTFSVNVWILVACLFVIFLNDVIKTAIGVARKGRAKSGPS